MSSTAATLAVFTPKDAVWAEPQTCQARIDKVGSADILRFPAGAPSTVAYFDLVIPRGPAGYSATTGIKVKLAWCVGADNPSKTGNVKWCASFQLDGATDTPIPYVDNFPATGGSYEAYTSTAANSTVVGGITYTLVSVTIADIQAANATAPAAGDHVRLRIRRGTDDTVNDTLAATAYLLAAELYDY